MKFLGLSMREWCIYGIGSSISGGLMAAVYHDLAFVALNAFLPGVNLYLLNVVEE